MPSRPEHRARYPADWPAISRSIRERSGGRCECDGRCGRSEDHLEGGRCIERNHEPAVHQRGRVVLTVAHLDHVPEHVEPENLRALCQACHLAYDREHHARTRARNRLLDAGCLFPPDNEG